MFVLCPLFSGFMVFVPFIDEEFLDSHRLPSLCFLLPPPFPSFPLSLSSIQFIYHPLHPLPIDSHIPFDQRLISSLSPQAQLIHDRNTASHATINDKADTGPERVHMTWTKDKLFTERNRNRECNANIAVRDMFNMKP